MERYHGKSSHRHPFYLSIHITPLLLSHLRTAATLSAICTTNLLRMQTNTHWGMHSYTVHTSCHHKVGIMDKSTDLPFLLQNKIMNAPHTALIFLVWQKFNWQIARQIINLQMFCSTLTTNKCDFSLTNGTSLLISYAAPQANKVT